MRPDVEPHLRMVVRANWICMAGRREGLDAAWHDTTPATISRTRGCEPTALKQTQLRRSSHPFALMTVASSLEQFSPTIHLRVWPYTSCITTSAACIRRFALRLRWKLGCRRTSGAFQKSSLYWTNLLASRREVDDHAQQIAMVDVRAVLPRLRDHLLVSGRCKTGLLKLNHYPVNLGELFILNKSGREATCQLRSHQFGWELRPFIGADDIV